MTERIITVSRDGRRQVRAELRIADELVAEVVAVLFDKEFRDNRYIISAFSSHVRLLGDKLVIEEGIAENVTKAGFEFLESNWREEESE